MVCVRKRIALLFILSVVLLELPSFAAAQLDRISALAEGEIETVAGNGRIGYEEDGKLATNSELRSPVGVALDALENLYIADRGNNRIRKVDASSGILTTVVGGGPIGVTGLFKNNPTGDGRAAIKALLNFPVFIAFDSGENMYIADSLNNRVRKVDSSSKIIYTVSGIGDKGFGADNQPAVRSKLAEPSAIALNAAGDIYIADTDNHRIRKIDSETGIITTAAGNSQVRFSGDGLQELSGGYGGDGGPANKASLNSPMGLCIDRSNNIYIADTDNNRIRRIDGSTGLITTIAGNGRAGYSGDGSSAIKARLNKPRCVVVDSAGNLFIADAGNNRIRRIDASSGIIFTVAGDGDRGYEGDKGPAVSAKLAFPTGLAIDSSGNLFIADSGNHVVRAVRKIAVKEAR